MTLVLQTNTFQLVIATDSEHTFVTFLYDDIQWVHGSEISSYAIANILLNLVFNVALPGSGTEDIRNLTTTSNVGVDGMWMYRVDSEMLISPAPI